MAASLTTSLVVRLIDRVSRPAQAISRSLLGIDKAAKGDFGQRLGAAIERNNAALSNARAGLFDAVAGFYALKSAIGAPVRAAAEFESAMADVRKVVDFKTSDEFKRFQDDLMRLSTTVPQTVNGLAQIAAAAGQAGIAGEELIPFTEAAAKIGVAFDISAGQAGDALAKLRTGLGITTPEAVLLSDAMNHLSNSQASSAAEILDVVRRVGAQAKLYGFSDEQTAAFASAMISAGAESEVAATSFRNMGLALTRGASATSRQDKALKALGLNAKEVAKRMQQDAAGTVVDVLERLSKLPKEIQGAVSSDLFGNEARALGPLLTNLGLVKDSLALVSEQSKYAGSAFREFEVRAKTFDNAVSVFNNRITALKIVIGNALIPALNDLMSMITPLITAVTDFAKANPELTRTLVGAAAAVVAFKVATSALTFVGLLGRGGALSMLALGFNSIAWAARAAKAQIGLQASLAALSGANYGGFAKLVDGIKGIAMAAPGVSMIGNALGLVGAAIAGISAPVLAAIGAAVAAIAVAGFMIWKYWDRVSSVFSGVAKRLGEEFAPAIEAARPLMEWLSGVGDLIGQGFEGAKEILGGFMSWLSGMFTQEVLSDDQKAAMADAGYQWADAMIQSVKDAINGLISWFAELPGRIISAIGSIDLGSIIQWPSPPKWWTDIFGGGQPAKSFGTLPAAPTIGADGSITGRARGGNMWAGSTYRINERGEEFFSPRSSIFAHKAGSVGRLGNVTFGDIIIQGASDPEETARRTRIAIRDEINNLLRGAHADMGARDS